jgi:hypothetical protein
LISRASGRHRQRAARCLEKKAGDKAFKVHIEGYNCLDYFKSGAEGDGPASSSLEPFAQTFCA